MPPERRVRRTTSEHTPGAGGGRARGFGRWPSPLPLPAPALVDAGRGIRLRPWRRDPPDVAALLRAWRDAGVDTARRGPAEVPEVGAERWLAGDAERRSRGLALDLVISPLEAGWSPGATAAGAPSEPAWGEVGLRNFDASRRRAEVGWWLAPEARGGGIAAAAVDLLVTWAQSSPLGLVQVWARVDPPNEASARVAARAGFRRLGTAGGTAVWSRVR